MSCKVQRAVSYPFLDRSFIIHNILLHLFVFKLEDCVYQDEDTQRQNARDHNCDCIYSARHIVYCHHNIHVIVGEASVFTSLNILLVTAHPVFEDWPGVARLHAQPLVIELPVLLPFVEVGVNYETKERIFLTTPFPAGWAGLCEDAEPGGAINHIQPGQPKTTAKWTWFWSWNLREKP